MCSSMNRAITVSMHPDCGADIRATPWTGPFWGIAVRWSADPQIGSLM
jgi:hypothetical protein